MTACCGLRSMAVLEAADHSAFQSFEVVIREGEGAILDSQLSLRQLYQVGLRLFARACVDELSFGLPWCRCSALLSAKQHGDKNPHPQHKNDDDDDDDDDDIISLSSSLSVAVRIS